MRKHSLKDVIKNIDKNVKRNNFPFCVKIKEGSWVNILKNRYERIGLDFFFTRNDEVLNNILYNTSYDYKTSNDFLFGIVLNKNYKKQLTLTDVSQQRELLKALEEEKKGKNGEGMDLVRDFNNTFRSL
jgi:hypothetical protein